MKAISRFLIAAGLVALSACSQGPYPRLGDKLDQSIKITLDSTTWISATHDYLRLLVLAIASPESDSDFQFTEVTPNSAVTLRSGTYRIDHDAAKMTFNTQTIHYLPADLSPSSKGATRSLVSESSSYDYQEDTSALALTGTPSLGTFIPFLTLPSQFETNTQRGAECAYRLLEVTELSSQAKIIGFGGGGTIQYTHETPFSGTLSGAIVIKLSSIFTPRTDLTYQNYSDFAGYVVNGTHSTKTSVGADGYNFGELEFLFASDSVAAPYTARVKYGESDGTNAVQIRGGATTWGAYHVTFPDGTAFDVPFDTQTRLADCITNSPPS